MKIKKILVSALVVVMLFTTFAGLIPVSVQAANYSSVEINNLSSDVVKKIVKAYRGELTEKEDKEAEYRHAAFKSAEEMFIYDRDNGYLDSTTNGVYTIYVNRYTGVLYYRHNETGEMLTSNPYYFENSSIKSDSSESSQSGGNPIDLTSQIVIKYALASQPDNTDTMYSSTAAADRNQITVSKINNGLRVSYTLGDTSTRYLFPKYITEESFNEDILDPLMEKIYEKLVECVGEDDAISFYDAIDQKLISGWDEKYLYTYALIGNVAKKQKSYFQICNSIIEASDADEDLKEETQYFVDRVKSVLGAFKGQNPGAYAEGSSVVKNWNLPETLLASKATHYVCNRTADAQLSGLQVKLKDVLPNYTFEDMYAHEDECGYKEVVQQKVVFRCSLEYTFNSDGSLSVRLPANSISFDETKYVLRDITPLKYFGAANFSNDGYFFIPDGSGTIVEFADFNTANMSLDSPISIYGQDYCYSELVGAHRQHITMPVYGVVTEVAGNDTGYFAIIEEGSSMAELALTYDNSYGKAGSVYTVMTPYPSDVYDATESGAQPYSKVSESKYVGSYVTRYVMLSTQAEYDSVNYNPNYMGMVEYYRDYLKDCGVLDELEDVSEDLPLYIEALGSMEVVEKILTFPVSVSKPITTFENIAEMYEELGDAVNRFKAKAEEYRELAAAATDNIKLQERYLAKAAAYDELADEKYNITNINFKLTGFTNGGMYYTYPSRVKWERVLGGEDGFNDLITYSKENAALGNNLGIYPDFDFQYINNTALFDGIGKSGTASKMVDNRYASKQVYSPITGEYDSIYALLVSPDMLSKFYAKFVDKYGEYDLDTLSLSTLGSDLNSNFDMDNPISRDEAQEYVSDLLDKIDSDYRVMIDKGNIYAVEYADHILDICTDSSYYRYSSYAIPFVGMILHGHVSYSGGALNYSGSPSYDILRSIESGAAPYYVLGYQNTDLMKDDELLSDYYSVDYESWYDDIIKNYYILNSELGDIQDYIISNHQLLTAERVIDVDEQIANDKALKVEFANAFEAALAAAVDEAHAKILEEILAGVSSFDKKVGISVDIDALILVAKDKLNLTDDEASDPQFRSMLDAVVDSYRQENYPINTDEQNVEYVSVDLSGFESNYQYVTDSDAFDENYDRTDYTVDRNVVLVTYTGKNGDTRQFLLNYNIFAVDVTINGTTIRIDKYDYKRL